MKPQSIDVTIRNQAANDTEPMHAGQIRWVEGEFMFYNADTLGCLSASDLKLIGQMVETAQLLVRE